MWGSRVGYGVEWPVRMDVLDRSLMDIGNRVVFSREVELAAHVRKKTDGGGSRVLVRHVRIGSYAFIGAGARHWAGRERAAQRQRAGAGGGRCERECSATRCAIPNRRKRSLR